MDLPVLILTCVVNLLLGFLVYLKDVRKRYAQAFGLMSVMICAWIVANYVTNNYSENLAITNLANSLAYASGLFIVLTGLLFTFNFPVQRMLGKNEKMVMVVSAIPLVILSFSSLVAGVVSLDISGNLTYSTGPLIWIYVVGFLWYVSLIVRNLFRIKKDSSIKKYQSQLVLLAFSVSAILGLLLNVIIPVFAPNLHTTQLGPLATIILVATITYAIVKHGLFDIRLAAVRSLTYLLSVATLAISYYLTAYAISASVLHDSGLHGSSIWVNISLALALVFLFQPVKGFFDKWTDKLFYRSNYKSEDFIARLSRSLAVPKDLKVLLEITAKDIAETLKLEQASFFVQSQHGAVYAGTMGHSRLSSPEIKQISDFVSDNAKEVIVSEILDTKPNKSLFSLLSRHKIAVTLPLWQADQVTGYLFLGEKRIDHYTQRDLKLLQTVRDELIIAIQNSLSVHEIKVLNRTLQQRIEEATSELRASNEQLRKLDAAKDEFVSMASHQLRTPLTSVKGYISMVLEGDAGDVNPTQRKLLEEAFTSSERMVHLISDFLNVSRLQTGKFVIDTGPVNLADLVSQEVSSLSNTAAVRSLKLGYRKPSHFPVLYLDEGKIHQVVMNFIDNAIYYSPEHTRISVNLDVEEGNAVFAVRDSGIGVPKSQQAHLFTKFFRADNARRQRPDGTGVGLFLAKKVIVAHGGTMVFESIEGEGSTFGFRLPITKLSQIPATIKDPAEVAAV